MVLRRKHVVSDKIQLLTPLLLQLRARGRYCHLADIWQET